MKKIMLAILVSGFFFSAVPCGWAKLTVGLPNAVKTFKSQMPVSELKAYAGKYFYFKDILEDVNYYPDIYLYPYTDVDPHFHLESMSMDMNFYEAGEGTLEDFTEAPDPMYYAYMPNINIKQGFVYYFQFDMGAVWGKFVVVETGGTNTDTFIKLWYQINYKGGREF
ncbi:hypothetical protein KAU32_03485 [bacterium]|nr:hypothetical protein [bacterium]